MAAGSGFMTSSAFDQFWPIKKEVAQIDFDSEDYKKWYAEMKIKNNLK